ncbi:MAG: 3-dehydroquinate synthase [Firmicutes bacterium]|nr:3-dehydroquinate synthase [Bacillota bacterium]
MTHISVPTGEPYEVILGKGLLDTAGERLKKMLDPETAIIVADSHTGPLFRGKLENSLKKAGIPNILTYGFPAGEARKNAGTYLSMLSFLADHSVTRKDCLLALGGGVVGDLTGFAAATYLRGIPYVQLPTTVLAVSDSSVGGKTAIDLPEGKNLVGCFYQPALVLADLDTLDTLPTDIFREGCGEVIKYAVLFDPELFEHLSEKGLNFDRERVLSQCVRWKRDVVVQDEHDHGVRQLLNLGHTIGHAVERCSNYQISHGSAVAMGLAAITRAARKMGICEKETEEAVLSMLNTFGLPVSLPYGPKELAQAALHDKKRSGGSISCIFPEEIGKCRIQSLPVVELEGLIALGVE